MKSGILSRSLALLGFLASSALAGTADESVAIPNVRKPVVLVPGIHDTGKTMEPLARYLRRRGFDAYTVSLTPSGGQVGLDDLARQVDAFVKQTLPEGQRFDLIGFSMGGLVTRYYVQRLGGRDRVDHFVTLSSPHHGTWLAHLIANPGCRQMRPGSEFLQDLNRDGAESLRDVKFTSFWSPLDTIILPASSSIVPTADNRRIWCIAHPLMVLDPRCMRTVADVLAPDSAGTRKAPSTPARKATNQSHSA